MKVEKIFVLGPHLSDLKLFAAWYNYTSEGKNHLLPDTWGSRCHSWEADDTSKGFVGDWGCTKELLAYPKHWCNDLWCYVDGCDCRDEFAIETLMWTGTKGLYFTYDFCCKQMKSKTDCTAKGSKCVWNAPNSKCFMAGNADTYIDNRCNTKATNWMDCAKWTSCTWKGNLNKCSAATASTRAKALSCPDAGRTTTTKTQTFSSRTTTIILGRDKIVSGAARSGLMATVALAAATLGCLTPPTHHHQPLHAAAIVGFYQEILNTHAAMFSWFQEGLWQ